MRFKSLLTYLTLLVPSFLLIAAVWSVVVSGHLYYCWDSLLLIDFIPPFVHSDPIGSSLHDYYIAPTWVVYSVWAFFIAAALWLPLFIVKRSSSIFHLVNRLKEIALRKWKVDLVGGFLLTLLTLWFAVTFRHHLGSDYSPDKLLRADYSYSCRSPVELLLSPKTNPIFYLKVIDLHTGKIILRDENFGSVAKLEEARECFLYKLPWNSPEADKASFHSVPVSP